MRKRDEFGQEKGEMSEADIDVLTILEEISTDPDKTDNPDKSLSAYMADIKEIWGVQ